ncbi:hypothetical protein [Aquitalea sp. ASV11]|uniref:hypothetical protein n=1 Tax=Aquitalea sp. ASV11 TaxID=2795103 RepID=UPI0018EC4591|nr:hypothetical protein [Aquitalea sp. ASV11]
MLQLLFGFLSFAYLMLLGERLIPGLFNIDLKYDRSRWRFSRMLSSLPDNKILRLASLPFVGFITLLTLPLFLDFPCALFVTIGMVVMFFVT